MAPIARIHLFAALATTFLCARAHTEEMERESFEDAMRRIKTGQRLIIGLSVGMLLPFSGISLVPTYVASSKVASASASHASSPSISLHARKSTVAPLPPSQERSSPGRAIRQSSVWGESVG